MEQEENLIKFCVENLNFKFKDADQVADAIVSFELRGSFVFQTGETLIQNDIYKLSKKVFEALPPEKKII